MSRCPGLQLRMGHGIHWQAQLTGLRPSSCRGMEAHREERPLAVARQLQAVDQESRRSASKDSDWKPV